MNTRIAFIFAMLTFQTLATVNREGKFQTAKSYGFLHIFKYSNHQLLIKDNTKAETAFKVVAETSDWYVWSGYQEKFAASTYKVSLKTVLNKDEKTAATIELVFNNAKVETLVATNYVLPKECINAPTFAAKLDSNGWKDNVKQLTLQLTCSGAKTTEEAPVKTTEEIPPKIVDETPVKKNDEVKKTQEGSTQTGKLLAITDGKTPVVDDKVTAGPTPAEIKEKNSHLGHGLIENPVDLHKTPVVDEQVTTGPTPAEIKEKSSHLGHGLIENPVDLHKEDAQLKDKIAQAQVEKIEKAKLDNEAVLETQNDVVLDTQNQAVLQGPTTNVVVQDEVLGQGPTQDITGQAINQQVQDLNVQGDPLLKENEVVQKTVIEEVERIIL